MEAFYEDDFQDIICFTFLVHGAAVDVAVGPVVAGVQRRVELPVRVGGGAATDLYTTHLKNYVSVKDTL